jgi:hypothetical protein
MICRVREGIIAIFGGVLEMDGYQLTSTVSSLVVKSCMDYGKVRNCGQVFVGSNCLI